MGGGIVNAFGGGGKDTAEVIGWGCCCWERASKRSRGIGDLGVPGALEGIPTIATGVEGIMIGATG